MPQLDVAAFLTNFFWFLLTFFTLYVILLKVFLPRLVKSFVFRSALSTNLLNNAAFSRLLLDYYGSNFQFLESTLSFSLLSATLISFRDSVDFQSTSLLFGLTEILEIESSVELSNSLEF